jgi:hypothetical protein
VIPPSAEAQNREDSSQDSPDYAAQDQASPECREPAEDAAGPTRVQPIFPIVPLASYAPPQQKACANEAQNSARGKPFMRGVRAV